MPKILFILTSPRIIKSAEEPVIGDVVSSLNTSTSEVRRGTRRIELAHKEFALLEFLMRHPNQVISRETMVEHVWNIDANHLSNVVDVYIRYLRIKLCAQGEEDVIRTIRGAGYQLKEPCL